MDNNLLIDNIRTLCKKNKVSISKLESDLFLSPGLISRWTKNSPAMDKIIDIAQYFNVTIDELVGRTTTKSDHKDIDRLLTILYNRSLMRELTWEILNFQDPPSNLENITPEWLSIYEPCDCFYTTYMGGYIFLAVIHSMWFELKFALYILPDIYSKPECVCVNNNQLEQIYEFISSLLSKQLNQMKCNNFINAFINDSNSIDAADEKVTRIRAVK